MKGVISLLAKRVFGEWSHGATSVVSAAKEEEQQEHKHVVSNQSKSGGGRQKIYIKK